MPQNSHISAVSRDAWNEFSTTVARRFTYINTYNATLKFDVQNTSEVATRDFHTLLTNTFGQKVKLRRAVKEQAPVVQRMDNAIQRINRYPVDKCWRKKLRYPLDSDLSGG